MTRTHPERQRLVLQHRRRIAIGVEELRELVTEAVGYSTHFRMVEVHYGAFASDRTHPDGNRLSIHWGMQARYF